MQPTGILAGWGPQAVNLGAGPTGELIAQVLLTEHAWLELARSLGLSGREVQIMRGVFANLKDAAIAEELSISEHTVHEHQNRLFRKLRVTTRTQMVVRIIEQLWLLTVSDSTDLPSICRERANGRCPLRRLRSAKLGVG